MSEYHRKDNLLGYFVNQSNAGLFAPWIDFQPNRLDFLLGSSFQNDRERESPQDCSFATGKKDPGFARIHRVTRFPIRINYQNVLHSLPFARYRVTLSG